MLKLISIILIIFTSCKEIDNMHSKKNELNNHIANKDTNISYEKTAFFDTIKQYPLPFGKKLVLTNFPEKWEYPSIYEEVDDRRKGKYEIILNSLNSYLDKFMYKTSLKINKEKYSYNYFINSANKYFNYYEDYTFYNVRWKIEEVKNVSIGKIKNFVKNIEVIITKNSTSSNYLNIVTIDSKRNIIDGINIGYSENVFEFSHSGKYYFIDRNRIIHLKSFLSLETETRFQRYEKYQILSTGKIVRYFNKNSGQFSSKEESGNIQNHTKEGIWIETKPNMYVEEHTYVKAKYKKGLPFGIWRYYNLINNTKKGDKLLMTEEYDKNGKLLKKMF
ncbi:MAG: hypothetical protein L3J23_05005 [Flavobacteriaceae bacterium]|nr:hypothetical protein [Flavobacteriaceae bacterium]